MRKLHLLCLAGLILSSAQALDAGQSKDLAKQALESRDYDLAINICLDQLNTEPENIDVHSLLAQAYAYSNRWHEALDVLEKILAAYPDNLDALLLWSRVQSWKKKYETAEDGYRKVLSFDPDNTDAKTGLAETAAWSGDYPEAISIYKRILQNDPYNAEIFYRLGRTYEWEGNYAKAKESYRAAIRIAPDKEEYRKALAGSHPQFRNQFEVRIQQRIESFSDKRQHYSDQSLVLLFASPGKKGTFLFKADQTRRLNERDNQYGAEFYPHLWKGAYGFFDLSFSPKAYWYPQTSLAVEVYQSFLSSAEFSIGYRRMYFKQDPVSICLGSLGCYIGNFYSFFRWYYSLQKEENTFSWTANLRHYFSQDNFVYVSFGQGSTPFDVATIDDFFITQSRRIQAGVIWYVLQRIRFEFYMNYINESDGPDRTAFCLSSGYRW